MRPLRSTLTLAAAAALFLVCPAWAGDLEDAAALRDKGKWAEALAKYEKAAAADPKSAAAALGRSESLLALGRCDEAAGTLADAIEANPTNAKLLTARSRAYLTRAEKAIRDGDDDNTIRTYSGDAAKWAKRALEADPKAYDAKVLLGRATAIEPDGLDKAWELFVEVITADPSNFDAHWEMGRLQWQAANLDKKNKGKWAAAEKSFRHAFAADPKSGESFYFATLAKQWQGTPGDYVSDYAGAARLLPGDSRPLTKLWSLRNQKGQGEAVLKALKELDGPKAKAYASALEAERALADGKAKDVDDLLVKALDAYPDGEDNNDLYFALDRTAFAGAGLEVKQRERLWTALWKKWPRRWEGPNNAGLWHRGDPGTGGDRDFKTAAEWYEKAAENAPQSPQVLNDTGLIYYFHLLDNKKAERWFRAAIKTANEQGIEPSNDPKQPEGVGFRDAMNNYAKLLAAEKRWKDLGEFAENDVPKRFPGRDEWIEKGKKGD